MRSSLSDNQRPRPRDSKFGVPGRMEYKRHLARVVEGVLMVTLNLASRKLHVGQCKGWGPLSTKRFPKRPWLIRSWGVSVRSPHRIAVDALGTSRLEG